MKDKASSKLKTMGKASIFPIALLPLAGLFLGLGTLFTNAVNIKVYGLQNILGKVYFVGISDYSFKTWKCNFFKSSSTFCNWNGICIFKI